ncbi:MAG: hypothetical protein M0Q14_08075 [Tissierellaceae bacterium]|nr:hypothetical protein [Tissierellaceae bacterium]
MELKEYLDLIETKLISNFDIERNYSFNNVKYDLFAKFYMRNERYFLTKKAVIYAMEANEFCFVKYFDNFNELDFQNFTKELIDSKDVLINLDDDHMSTIITGVIVLKDKPTDEIAKTIEKFKYYKSFAFGLKGWVDIRLVLVAMNQKYIVTNKKGKEVKDVYSI